MRPENISAKTGMKNPGQKAAATSQQNMKVLAIPYYSQLVRSHGGLEHIYFRVTVDSATGVSSKPKLCVWNPKELPSLPEWLAQQGVETLLCSDNRPNFEGMFQAAGITISWDQRGEVADMVNRWVRTLPAEDNWQQQRTAFA